MPLICCFKYIIFQPYVPQNLQKLADLSLGQNDIQDVFASPVFCSPSHTPSPMNLNSSQRPCPHNRAGVALPCTPQLKSPGAHKSCPNIKIKPLSTALFLSERHPNAQEKKELG